MLSCFEGKVECRAGGDEEEGEAEHVAEIHDGNENEKDVK